MIQHTLSIPILVVCYALLVGAIGSPLLAIEHPPVSAEQIVAKYVEAVGGLEALKNIHSRTIRYRVHMLGRDAYSMERSWSRPDIMRSGRPGAPGYTLTEGKNSWRVDPEGRRKLPAHVAAALSRRADIDGPLVESSKKGISLEYVGTETYDMTDLHQIRLTFKDGVRWELFFDAHSGLLRRKKEPSFRVLDDEVTRGPDAWTYFYDYRPAQGVLFPHVWVQATDDYTHVFTLEELRINE